MANLLKEKQAVLSVDLFIHRESTDAHQGPCWGRSGEQMAHRLPTPPGPSGPRPSRAWAGGQDGSTLPGPSTPPS